MKIRTVAAPEICQHTPEGMTGKCMPCKKPFTHRRKPLGGDSPFEGLKMITSTAASYSDFLNGKLRFTIFGVR